MALRLRSEGVEAFALEGGFDAWLAAGLPAEPKAVVPELSGAQPG